MTTNEDALGLIDHMAQEWHIICSRCKADGHSLFTVDEYAAEELADMGWMIRDEPYGPLCPDCVRDLRIIERHLRDGGGNE